MSDLVSPAEQRAADLRDLEQRVNSQEALVSRLWSTPATTTEALAEDRDYELFQQERYLEELRAELEVLQKAPILDIRRTRSLSGPANGLAIVVGHSKIGKDPGAEGKGFPASVAGEMRYEVHWNGHLAELIEADAKSRGLPCRVFRRDSTGGTGVAQAYRNVADWGPRATVELHFNASGGAGHGTETLYGRDGHRAGMDWAQALQSKMLAVYVPAAAAKGIQRSKGPWQDRKVKDHSRDRGSSSLNALDPDKHGPTALIEPFFGDNADDAPIAEETKPQLARALVDAYVEHFKLVAPRPDKPAAPNLPPPNDGPTATAPQKPDRFSEEFYALMLAYAAMTSPPPNLASLTPVQWVELRDVSLAQWALETGYGKGPPGIPEEQRLRRTELPRLHKNFGGQKYRQEMAPYATPVRYTDWQAKTDDYCSFATYEKFVEGYWARFDIVSNYKGWKDHTRSAEAFINFIGPIYAPTSDGNRDYQTNVLDVLKRLKAAGHVPSAVRLATVAVAGGTDVKDTESTNAGNTGAGNKETLPPTAGDALVPRLDQLVAVTASTVSAADAAMATGLLPIAVSKAIEELKSAASGLSPAAIALKEKIETAAGRRSLAQLAKVADPKADPLFLQLATLLEDKGLAPAEINHAILAHWALMSGWGRSDLARVHYNFAGLKWQDDLEALAGAVVYKDGQYCRFSGLDRFLAAYWHRLETPPLEGCLAKSTAAEFLAMVALSWAPGEAAYVSNCSAIVSRLADAARGRVPAPPSAPEGPAKPEAQPGLQGADPTGIADHLRTGFVIHVKRAKVETRNAGTHRIRTVGTYQTYFQGQKLAGLEGTMFEQKGPGDNTSEGGVYDRRIKAGRYPLCTQAGTKYKTHEYTATASSNSAPRPGILVGSTDKRIAILLHPAEGWLWSEGCLNLSKPLAAGGMIDWGDSFQRTVAMIEAMEAKLGERFPASNGKPIPNAWLVVEGEPEPPASTRSLLEARTRSTAGGASGPAQISDEMLKRLRPPELFAIMADAINGGVLVDLVDQDLFERAIKIGDYDPGWLGGMLGSGKKLADLRGPDGETLWLAWARGWQANQSIADPEKQKAVQRKLEAIALRLKALGVDINAAGKVHTPLTAMAKADAGAAVRRLAALGAVVDAHDPLGNTGLGTAAFFAAPSAVEALLAAGAKPQVRALTTAEAKARRHAGSEDIDEIYAEPPPAGATALEAAKAALAALSFDRAAPSAAQAALATTYEGIIAKLEGNAAAR